MEEKVRMFSDVLALNSLRDSDFDAYSAYGEVIDNSIQAEAKNVNLRFDKDGNGTILNLFFGDDGTGMPKEVLHKCMQLGYSTRYNERTGIGRFGVGSKLAAINQCKRLEMYSKTKEGEWFFCYIDLDEINKDPSGEAEIHPPIKKEIPKDIKGLVGPESGTLVIWSKYDRQPTKANTIMSEAKTWIGRTYRKFIWKKISIRLNGQEIKAIDPLYCNVEKTNFPDDPLAYEYTPMEITWPVDQVDRPKEAPDKSTIKIRMSLIDKKLRVYRGVGNAPETKERCIDRNEGVSILRADREVFYGHIPYWPGEEFKDIDRWWGCEISFDPWLDRSFLVKNIKRGAIPIPELKNVIYEKITPTRKSAVEQVQKDWNETALNEAEAKRKQQGELITGHEDAEQVAAETPTDKSEIDKSRNKGDEAKKLAGQIAQGADAIERAAWATKFEDQPFTIKDGTWKGPSFIDINHIGGSDVIIYNTSHLFFSALSEIMTDLDQGKCDINKAKKLKSLIDLLLIAYSKSEAKFDAKMKFDSAEKFLEMLRLNWGLYLSHYIETWEKKEDKNG